MLLLHKLEKAKPLSSFSTFGIGGPAHLLIEVKTLEEMKEALRYAREEKLFFILIGKGSNSLFDDRGFAGLAIVNRIGFCHFNESQVEVGAGYSFALLGVQTARKGFSGLEFASGIPGTVGGAVYMNAGASGKQTMDALSSVTYLFSNGEEKVFKREELEFAYRTSPFQKMKGAIVAATFNLTPAPEARKTQLEIVDYRTRTQPYSDKSCGCVFRNPQGGSAGKLIEESGLKGAKIGGAEVSLVHANFIVNRGEAKAEEVMALAKLVRETVYAKTGIELEMELCVIPYISS